MNQGGQTDLTGVNIECRLTVLERIGGAIKIARILNKFSGFVFFVAEISPKNYLAEGVLKSDRFSATDEGVLRCRCLTSP